MNLILNKLRNKIDKIDNKIFYFLNKRFNIINKIGYLKNKNNIPIYIKKREEEVIYNKINSNEYKNISSNFIKNILKKIIYESYIKEFNSKIKYKNKKNNLIKITFIGGRGKMGNIFKNIFSTYNYNVLEINSKDWINSDRILINSNVIFICSTIDSLDYVLDKIKPFLNKECILVDIFSIKKNPIRKILSIHNGPVLGLHPMFGPNIKSITKQVIICCDGRYPIKYKWILDKLKICGANIYYMSYNKHDKYMSYIQSLRYINFIFIGSFLMNENININKFIKISPPIYQIYLSLIGKFYNENPNLYLNILFSSKENLLLINKYIKNILSINDLLKNNNKNELLTLFNKTKLWMNINNNKLSNLCDNLLEEYIIKK